ncbi:MAG: hypothetical protein KF774_21910 [Planctomyces sp.]|nr:hypothetical protein [Planctomyces sp.]
MTDTMELRSGIRIERDERPVSPEAALRGLRFWLQATIMILTGMLLVGIAISMITHFSGQRAMSEETDTGPLFWASSVLGLSILGLHLHWLYRRIRASRLTRIIRNGRELTFEFGDGISTTVPAERVTFCRLGMSRDQRFLGAIILPWHGHFPDILAVAPLPRSFDEGTMIRAEWSAWLERLD